MKAYSKLKKPHLCLCPLTIHSWRTCQSTKHWNNYYLMYLCYCYLKPNWGQSHFKVIFQFLLTATLSSTFNTEFILKMSREMKGLKKCDSIKTLAPLWESFWLYWNDGYLINSKKNSWIQNIWKSNIESK